MGENQASKKDLADKVGVAHPRITELLKDRRQLSMYYIELFIKKGVFMVDDIFDGTPETPEEREAWDYLKLIEDKQLMEDILKAYKGGLKRDSLREILKTHFKD